MSRRSEPRWFHAIAPAKVNLSLEVLGARSDGYHDVSTWMIAVDLCDRISARRSGSRGITFSVGGPMASSDIPSDERNLAWRAASAALEARGRAGALDEDLGIELYLEKHVPSQAGLGGGSADAAAAWIAVESALEANLGVQARDEALAHLGSDCVFFAGASHTGVGLCEGRGERVQPAGPLAHAWWVAIVTPAVLASTRDVYQALPTPLSDRANHHSLPHRWFDLPARDARAFFFNRLEDAALHRIDALRPWRRLLDECDAEHFRLAGSGASFFGVFDDRLEADESLRRIRALARERELDLRGAWTTRSSLGARLVLDS